MEEILNQLLEHFDFTYMLVVNILTYMLIKGVDDANGDKPVSVLGKRLLLIGATIIVFVLYRVYTDVSNDILINSTIAAPVAWDFVFRPLFKKFNLGYKENKEKDEQE